VSTTTSLTLRALLKDAVTRTGLDVPGGDVTGLSPSAQALAVAALAHAEPERLIVTIVPSDADVDRATADVRFFLSAIEGLPEAAAERVVLPLPSHEIDPYRGLAPHLRVTSARARALHAAAAGRGRVVTRSISFFYSRPCRMRCTKIPGVWMLSGSSWPGSTSSSTSAITVMQLRQSPTGHFF